MNEKLIVFLAMIMLLLSSLVFSGCGFIGSDESEKNNDSILTYSEGLKFSQSADQSFYSVSGVGTCSDKQIVIPPVYNSKPVTGIDQRAFWYNINIESVIMPDSITLIGESAFFGCSSLSEVKLSAGLKRLCNRAFYDCSSLKSIVIPDGVTTIEEYTFVSCSSLENIFIHDGVKNIGEGAFMGCVSLESVILPKGIRVIDKSTFQECKGLTSIIVPEGVTKIDDSAFRDCYKLLSITIPRSISSIEWEAFAGCSKIIEVVNNSSLDISVGNSDFGYIAQWAKEVHKGESKIQNKDGFLFYTFEHVNYLIAYMGDNCDITLPDSFNGESYEIYRSAFANDRKLVKVVIPDSVTAIGAFAFGNQGSLVSISIGSGVTRIDGNSFCEDCTKLVEVVNKTSFDFVNEIHLEGVFTGTEIICIAKDIHKEDSKLINVDGYLFYVSEGDNQLVAYVGNETELTLPQGYKGKEYAIYKYAFSGKKSITKVTIPSIVSGISINAFEGCTSLVHVTIKDGAGSIGDRAFYGCSALESIVIGTGGNIGNAAFSGCSSLKKVYYTGSEEDWKQCISIGEYNPCLIDAEKHYNYVQEN